MRELTPLLMRELTPLLPTPLLPLTPLLRVVRPFNIAVRAAKLRAYNGSRCNNARIDPAAPAALCSLAVKRGSSL